MSDFMALLPGWKIAEKLGAGSYGAVYRITRELFDINEEAALKVMSIPKDEDTVAEMRLEGYSEQSILEDIKGRVNNVLREYKTSKALSGNTNIVDVDDLVIKANPDGLSYEICMKMELLTPLMKTIAREAFFTEEQTIKLAKDMCKALIACQKLNIIHRDIKPENIMLSKFGDYKLGDFGIAKAVEKTMGGTKAGTNKFIAPEVYNNQPYGHRVDIYSLGLVLYWMLNKKRIPFLSPYPETIKGGEQDEAIARRTEGEQILPPADGSDDLKAIVLKACAFNPEDRYQTAKDMLDDLERLGTSSLTDIEFSNPTKVLEGEFKGNLNVTYAVIPEGVTEILSDAFANCTNLKAVVFPSTLQFIGNRAFSRCVNLSQVTISSEVTSVGDEAFMGCTNLDVSMLNDDMLKISLGRDAFAGCKSSNSYMNSKLYDELAAKTDSLEKQLEEYKNKVYIANQSKTTSDESEDNDEPDIVAATLITPNNSKVITKSEFAMNSQLRHIVIPSTVEVIEDSAFWSCPNLESVTIKGNIKSIGSNAFELCLKLKTVIIEGNLETIGNNAFSGCKNLRTISIPDSVKKIGMNSFKDCSLKTIKLPTALEVIETSVFENCYLLDNVIIPENVTRIEMFAFAKCTSLKDITLNRKIKEIQLSAFKKCAFDRIEVPLTIRTYKGAFEENTKVVETIM